MAKETIHVVQAYVAGRGKALKSEPPMACKSADEALRRATRLSTLRLGVVAFSTTVDAEMGDYDDQPTILFRAGRLPPPFDE
jgi:hypothetical protein